MYDGPIIYTSSGRPLCSGILGPKLLHFMSNVVASLPNSGLRFITIVAVHSMSSNIVGFLPKLLVSRRSFFLRYGKNKEQIRLIRFHFSGALLIR